MVSPPGYVYDNNNINNINSYINKIKSNKNYVQKESEKNKLVYNCVMHCINQIKKNEIIRNETINVDVLMARLNEMMSTTDNMNKINLNDYQIHRPQSAASSSSQLAPWQLETCQPVYDEYACAPGRMVVPKKEEEDNACSICMDKEKCMAFINCGHMCICETCTQRVDKCPICRTQGPIIKIYK